MSSQRQVTLFLWAVAPLTDEAGIFRFQRNCESSSTLFILTLPLLATGVQDGTPFVALDYLPTSRQYHPFPLPISTVISVCCADHSDALDHAHSQDVCPSYSAPEQSPSLGLTVRRFSQVLACGYWKSVQSPQQSLDKRWEYPVPLCYLPPEQLIGAPIGPFSDQYALAAIVYEWLCGIPLFHSAQSFQTAIQIIQTPPLREKGPMISSGA